MFDYDFLADSTSPEAARNVYLRTNDALMNVPVGADNIVAIGKLLVLHAGRVFREKSTKTLELDEL